MPIPEQRPGESDDDFMERCMGDAVMNKEYQDKKQRYKVCESKMRKNKMNFQKYDHKKNEDGSYDILQVPIFELGKHKGFKYDEDWFKQTQDNMLEDEQHGHLPPVLIGHNDGRGEKPAKGFFKNLALKGEQIIADITKIPKDMFEEIKDRAYPYRSVEVVPKQNKITALALLGGTEPYHHLPMLEIFEDEKGKEILNMKFDEGEEQSFFEQFFEQFKDWFSHNKQDVNKPENKNEESEMADKFTKEDLDQAKKDAESKAEKQFKDQFKKQYGVTPKEMADIRSKEKQKARANEIKTFCSNLKEKSFKIDQAQHQIAPAVIDDFVQPFLNADEKVKFSDEDEMDKTEAFKHIFNTVLDKAAKAELFVNMDEQGEHDKDSGDVKDEFDSRTDVNQAAHQLHKKVVKYCNKNELNVNDPEDYQKALTKVAE